MREEQKKTLKVVIGLVMLAPVVAGGFISLYLSSPEKFQVLMITVALVAWTFAGIWLLLSGLESTSDLITGGYQPIDNGKEELLPPRSK